MIFASVYTCAGTCRSPRSTLGMFLYWSPPFLRQSLLLNLKFTVSTTQAGRPLNSQNAQVPTHQSCMTGTLTATPGFCVGARDQNLGPHACLASTVPTEPPSRFTYSKWLFHVVFLFANRKHLSLWLTVRIAIATNQ